ncbi:unnamed protein product [Brassica rapa subsp. trilocularis]
MRLTIFKIIWLQRRYVMVLTGRKKKQFASERGTRCCLQGCS